MKKILCFLFLLIVTFTVPAFAEVKEIIAEGNYIMGDGETPSVAHERAVVDAKRAAVEQAGTYLESITEVKNLQLTKDEIRIFAAGLVETVVVDAKRTVGDNNSIKFWVKVKCIVKTDNLQAMSNKLHEEDSVAELAKRQAEIDKLNRENTELKRQLTTTRTTADKQAIEAHLAQNEQTFTAQQWYDKAYDYKINKKDRENALAALSKALELNPQYASAYNLRGTIFHDARQYDEALADYNKAIEFDPGYAVAYRNRGLVYRTQNQIDLALANYNKALELSPRYAFAYNDRGNLYFENLEKYDLAIADYSKTIAINPRYFIAYNNRGMVYAKQKQYGLAMEDYNQAITISPRYVNAYHNRGIVYKNLKEYELAIADFDKVLEINSRYAYAYYNKADSLAILGFYQQAIDNFRLFLRYAKPGDVWIERAEKRIHGLENMN